MTKALKSAKENQSIPKIHIESSFCTESCSQASFKNDSASSSFYPDNEQLFENNIPLYAQISQFACWFSDLTSSRQFLVAVLVLKYLQSDQLRIIHALLSTRISELEVTEASCNANDAGYVSQLHTLPASNELATTLLTLLPHFTKPVSAADYLESSMKINNHSSKDVNSNTTCCGSMENSLKGTYLELIDKIFQHTVSNNSNSTDPSSKTCLPVLDSRDSLHERDYDDEFESTEGQLLLFSLYNPVFTAAEKEWLSSNIRLYYRNHLDQCRDDDRHCPNRSASHLMNLLAVFADFPGLPSEISYDDYADKRTLRISKRCSIGTPFLSRSTFPCVTRRHNSLIPGYQTTDYTYNEMCKSDLHYYAHPSLSNSSLNSSGFISGCDSVHQGLSQICTNDIRDSTPTCGPRPTVQLSQNRLCPPTPLFLSVPSRRQSASPYILTTSADQLDEGDEDASILLPKSKEFRERAPYFSCSAVPWTNLSSGFEVKKSAASSVDYEPNMSVNFYPTENKLCDSVFLSIPLVSDDTYVKVIDSNIGQISLPRAHPEKANNQFYPLFVSSNSKDLALSTATSSNDTSLWSPIQVQIAPPDSNFEPFSSRSGAPGTNNKLSDIGKASRRSDPDMASVPVWLKSLRLHKYIGLFQQLTYSQMMNLTEEWLQRQHVTQGARNKILLSIKTLSGRSISLKCLEEKISNLIGVSESSSSIHCCLEELRNILHTPLARSPHFCQQRPASSSSIDVSLFPGDTASQLSNSTNPGEPDDDIEPFFVQRTSDDDFVDDEDNHDTSDQCEFFLGYSLRRSRAVAKSSNLLRMPLCNSDSCLDQREKKKKTSLSSFSGFSARTHSCDETDLIQNPVRLSRYESNFNRIDMRNTLMREQENILKPEKSIVQPVQISCHEKTIQENLPAQIISCLSKGFSFLLSCANYDREVYASFADLINTVLDNSSFTSEQKSVVHKWKVRLAEIIGPPPSHRAYKIARPSRTQTKNNMGDFQTNLHSSSFLSLPYTPRPQQRVRKLQIPSSSGYANHYSLSPIRPAFFPPDDAAIRVRSRAISPMYPTMREQCCKNLSIENKAVSPSFTSKKQVSPNYEHEYALPISFPNLQQPPPDFSFFDSSWRKKNSCRDTMDCGNLPCYSNQAKIMRTPSESSLMPSFLSKEDKTTASSIMNVIGAEYRDAWVQSGHDSSSSEPSRFHPSIDSLATQTSFSPEFRQNCAPNSKKDCHGLIGFCPPPVFHRAALDRGRYNSLSIPISFYENTPAGGAFTDSMNLANYCNQPFSANYQTQCSSALMMEQSHEHLSPQQHNSFREPSTSHFKFSDTAALFNDSSKLLPACSPAHHDYVYRDSSNLDFNMDVILQDQATAEINRNLDLLTQKVTKLAIEESDSTSE